MKKTASGTEIMAKGEESAESAAKDIGITAKKSEDFSEWFSQVVLKSELADYSSVSGCIVLRPLGYEIWDKVRELTDQRIKKLGVKNCYFPLFIPESLLSREQEHVEGFSPEVAWVTHAGDTKLSERLAVRPTSETIMYDSFAKWIRSWRDLPLKLNQWNNVVRWEFKHPTLLLRTREFWWNEGHTAFATKEEADEEIEDIMDIWKEIVFEFMALYGVAGKKSQKEKFAGALATYSIESFSPNGKFIQGPDAHSDGQNFAKAYDIKFLDRDGKEKYVFQNTWAISTRMIGTIAAVHGDDKGLILPPRLAPNKIVIIPIIFKDSKTMVLQRARELAKLLEKFNPIVDEREEYSAGWKFSEWELKGIPIRIEIGPKDIEKSQVMLARRDNGTRQAVNFNNLQKFIPEILEQIHSELYEKSKKLFEKNIVKPKDMQEFIKAINNKKIVLAPFCNEPECEDCIKEKTGGASSRVMAEERHEGVCIHCNKPSKCLMYFGKSY